MSGVLVMRRSGVRLPKAAPPRPQVSSLFGSCGDRSTLRAGMGCGMLSHFGPTVSRMSRGSIEALRTGFRARVYAGKDPITGRQNYLRGETRRLRRDAEADVERLLAHVEADRRPDQGGWRGRRSRRRGRQDAARSVEARPVAGPFTVCTLKEGRRAPGKLSVVVRFSADRRPDDGSRRGFARPVRRRRGVAA
jgi:hypothetical protein